MMTADQWQTLNANGGLIDLSGSAKLRLRGPDALRYLNGQVSNDVRRLVPGGPSMAACICSHKGRLEALVLICRDAAGDFFLTADAALRDFLPLRTGKYLIADDAVVEDIAEAFDLVHAFGPAPRPGIATAGPGAVPAGRYGMPGTDLWLPAGAARRGMTFTRTEAVETLRIDRGIPAWENELASGILPPEARLEETAIDYHKGCYTGQEVISRLRSVGRVNRLLCRLISPDGGILTAGSELFTVPPDGPEQSAGHITSAAWHPLQQTGIALGWIHRQAMDRPLRTGTGMPVEIRMPLDDPAP